MDFFLALNIGIRVCPGGIHPHGGNLHVAVGRVSGLLRAELARRALRSLIGRRVRGCAIQRAEPHQVHRADHRNAPRLLPPAAPHANAVLWLHTVRTAAGHLLTGPAGFRVLIYDRDCLLVRGGEHIHSMNLPCDFVSNLETRHNRANHLLLLWICFAAAESEAQVAPWEVDVAFDLDD